ncbi:MAG: SRPBCC domain-containing protein [Gammaproteobacteria bacterium]|nr:MAG: SRPBCC domain-containing protein [Gammaproteobacteria bacterium]
MIDPEAYDWSRFEIVFYYDQPRERVFRAWATSSGLESFFIEHASFESDQGRMREVDEQTQAGDAYLWEWRQPHTLEGTVLEVIPDALLSVTFGSMTVTLRFADAGAQTELHLTQTGISDTPDGHVFGHLNCRSCWIFFLTNLKSVLQSGPDLRDQDPARVSSMEVGFRPLIGSAGTKT